ncbi:MAG: hypothetical protein ACE5I1_12225 [bacterium]
MELTNPFKLLQILHEKGGEQMNGFFSLLRFLFVLVIFISFALAALVVIMLYDKNIL